MHSIRRSVIPWRILGREIIALNVQTEIAERVAKLSPQMQEQVLDFVSSLEAPAPKGESGAALVRFAGSLDDVSAREIVVISNGYCRRPDRIARGSAAVFRIGRMKDWSGIATRRLRNHAADLGFSLFDRQISPGPGAPAAG